MLGVDLLSRSPAQRRHWRAPIEQHAPDAAAQTQLSRHELQTAHQSHHHSLAAAFRESKQASGSKPLAKQGGHCGIGAAHRKTTDQKTEQIHPMAQERITQVLIHQRAKGINEMAY